MHDHRDDIICHRISSLFQTVLQLNYHKVWLIFENLFKSALKKLNAVFRISNETKWIFYFRAYIFIQWSIQLHGYNVLAARDMNIPCLGF